MRKFSQFKCSVFPPPQCYSHCNMLCRTQAKARKAGNPPNNGGGVGEVGAGEGVEAGVVMDGVGETMVMEINPGQVATHLTQL